MEKSAEQQQEVPPPAYNSQQHGYPGHPQQGSVQPPSKGFGPPPQRYGNLLQKLGIAAPHRQPGQYNQQRYQNNNVVIQQPGNVPVVTGPAPPDRMGAAIFVTICCFWPTGIVAIMRANDARTALMLGDIPAAAAHSRSARSMVIISAVIGVITLAILAIILGVYFGLYASSASTTRYTYYTYG